MRNHLRTSLATVLLIGALASPAVADKQFNAGSLIIPPSAAFQTDCGAVAIYGLVYDILRANAYITAHPLLFPKGPIEVYYSYRDTKNSPNRCTPTNKSVNPAPIADPRWLDGCDFEVYNNSATPVTLVKNATPLVADGNVSTFDNISSSSVSPAFAPETIDKATGYNKVRYLGGPFIIDSSDAPYFLSILAGTTVVWDNAAGALPGHIISFAPFRSAAACNYGTSVGGYVNIHRAAGMFTAPAPRAFTATPPRVALLATAGVNISTTDLAYPTVNIEKPSKSGATESGTTVTLVLKGSPGVAVGAVVDVEGVNNNGYNGLHTITGVNAVAKTVTFTAAAGLPNSGNGSMTKSSGAKKVGTIITLTTIANHGLVAGDSVSVANVDCGSGFQPACPGYNGIWTITAAAGKSITIDTSIAPNVDPGVLAPAFSGGDVTKQGGASTGSVSDGILQKYLSIAGLSFVGAGGCPPGGLNVLNLAKCPTGGTPGQVYDTFDFSDFATLLDASYGMVWTPHWETRASAAVAPNAAEQAMITKIQTFLDGQTGLMAECHSIESFEGIAAQAQGFNPGQFQTCAGAGTTCSGSTPFGLIKNLPGPGQAVNCTDPGIVNGNKCTFFGDPGDPFAQPADYVWNPHSGSVSNYSPNTPTAIYRPFTHNLISGVNSVDTSKTSSYAVAKAAGIISTDYVSRATKDGDAAKGNILYMGGHDVSGVVSGAKVVLQTLLLLGAPPVVQTTVEVTRSSPIASILGGQNSLVQGSFEKVTPPPTTLFTNDDTTADAFRFPDVIGHMRAIPTANVTTTQTSLDDSLLTPIFDAADQLPITSATYTPPATSTAYTGCGAQQFGAAGGGCRTIFTHTQTTPNPARVVLDSSAVANATLLGLINTNGGTLTSAGLAKVIQRVIGGIESTPGTFVPKLGGVDRSTVAVIPTSLVAGVTRPTVIYFGATDGMLHAVCGSVIAGTGCDVLGRELWAFIPRMQLANIRKNAARIEGSPRVMDVYGDFSASGTRSFHTILLFQSGSGDPSTGDMVPSTTELDITNPFNPQIVWDFHLANAGARQPFEPGQGLILSAGPVRVGGIFKNYAFIQTNNGGTSGVGNVVTAVDMEDASVKWTHPVLATGRGGTAPPDTAIPGGAVGVDKQSTGAISDVVFGTLYGELWQVDAATGDSREGGGNPGTALFRYTADQHPIGASPAIYSNGGSLFALAVSGGYADLSTATTLWSATSQTAVAVSLSTPVASAPQDEGAVPAAGATGASGAYIPRELTFFNDDKAYAQPVIVGDQAFITTDTLDINDSSAVGYGVAATNTGRVYVLGVADGSISNVVTRGGAGSVAVAPDRTTVIVESKDKVQRLTANNGAIGGTGDGAGGAAVDGNGSLGESPGSLSTPKVVRLLWLRTL